MALQRFESYRIRLYQVCFGFLVVFAGFWIVSKTARGSSLFFKLFVALTLGTVMTVWLDRRYWLFVPWFFYSGVAIPGVPFSGMELAALSVIAVFFCRSVVERKFVIRIDRDVLTVLPVFFWMALVFLLNPPGLASLGSTKIGLRFYLQIVFAFFALLVLSAQRFDERDGKLLFFSIVAAHVVSLFMSMGLVSAFRSGISTGEEQATQYGLLGFTSLFIIVFSRYPISRILSSVPLIFLCALFAGGTILSGKRRAFGTIVLVPVFRAFLVGRDKLVTIFLALVAFLLLVFAVAGDGVLYEIPKSATRSLAVVFPQYRQSDDDGGLHDYFREQMRAGARQVISSNPWFGREGFAIDIHELAWYLSLGATHQVGSGHAISGNWHSTWYGFAADFGIPCMVFWAFFNAYALVFAFKACRLVRVGTFLPACCMFFSLVLFTDFAFSYTSGHSAVTPLSTWLTYGMLLAVVRGYRLQQHLPLD